MNEYPFNAYQHEAVNGYPFNAYQHEVTSILNNKQTMFRRVMQPQPYKEYGCFNWAKQPLYIMGFSDEQEFWQRVTRHCPYGKAGDRLWVRETWASHPTLNKVRPQYLDHAEIYYRATCSNDSHYSWRPSIHMPRWASRITLEVTSIRVERVKDITLTDVFREGVTETASMNPVGHFKHLWDTANAKRGYSWDSNPWVWVVEFRRVAAA